MKVVITAAGQSKRFLDQGFELPKFMLPVFRKTMLEQVLEMFSQDDSFLVLTTDTLKKQFESYFETLAKKYKYLEVAGIEEHSLGPVQTLLHKLSVEWIGEDDFIVSYCDFFLNWNYASFLSHIKSVDMQGCIVSFNGLQPASRGNTLFAYLRVNADKVLEVREKSSFTENRIQEFASAGVYYFRSLALFRNAVEASEKYFQYYPERYVSLVYNGMIDLGYSVSHFSAQQFVCLGTPQDYNEFNYWNSYFDLVSSRAENSISISNKLIPMAGFGDRFRRAGIAVPKPLIPVRNEAMFLHAVDSCPKAARSYLVVMQDQLERIQRATSTYLQHINIIGLSARTDGPGETILQAFSHLPEDQDVLVMSCDYEQTCEPHILQDVLQEQDVKVVLFYTHFSKFRMANPEAFAYCITNEQGIVQKIIEKELISDTPESDKLLVGSFWFREAKYLKIALELAKTNHRYVNGELYVANSLNELLDLGIKIKAIPVNHWISFGDPDEFEIYSWWEDLFNNLKSSL